ncbi:MAG: hypothetical protein DMG69_11060 [Acidobacteria bacterium]|nr:MAG: hypothetical protein DMG69_11060 [Acidobacteriota bacterium]
MAAGRVILHVLAVPEQAPDQLSKATPLEGVSVRVTAVPGGKLAVQVWPQLMPAGLLATVPAPVTVTVS